MPPALFEMAVILFTISPSDGSTAFHSVIRIIAVENIAILASQYTWACLLSIDKFSFKFIPVSVCIDRFLRVHLPMLPGALIPISVCTCVDAVTMPLVLGIFSHIHAPIAECERAMSTSFVVLIISFEFVTIRPGKLAVAVLLVILVAACISGSVDPGVHTLTMLVVILITPNVLIAILLGVRALAIVVALEELSNVLVAVAEGIDTMPAVLSVYIVALVTVAILPTELVLASPMLLVVLPGAFESVSIDPLADAPSVLLVVCIITIVGLFLPVNPLEMAMLPVILPGTSEGLTTCLFGEDTCSITLIMSEFAFVPVAIVPKVGTLAMHLTMLPLSIVLVASATGVDSLSMSLVIPKLAFIAVSISHDFIMKPIQLRIICIFSSLLTILLPSTCASTSRTSS